MKSKKTKRFDKLFEKLPEDVKEATRKTFKLWLENPFHPSLHFKCIVPSKKIWSIRITTDYRAIGYKREDIIYWDWIGNHSDYEREIKRRR